MKENAIYPTNQYIETFTKIWRAAEEYSYLWNNTISKEGLGIFRVIIDEQQDWEESYNLKKGKDGKLHFFKDDNIISITDLVKDIQGHNHRGTKISPKEVSTNFVNGLSEYVRKYEIASIKVDEKVKNKMQKLERILF